ncbi:MAG: hypothetical protein V2I50_13625 [Desulfuromusa sp.]|jgi:hypothetical protein|nr:hypothetical protein [Desulfuromusa sp.]
MGAEFDINKENKILYLIYVGEVDYEERIQIRKKTIKHLKEKRFKKLFVDTTKCTFNMSIREYFELVFRAEENEIENDVKIAVFIKENDVNNEFMTRTIFNRGLIIKAFTTQNDALKWLS